MNKNLFAALLMAGLANAIILMALAAQTNEETEAPVVAEKTCLPEREIVTDEEGNQRVLVWTKVETYYTSERMPNGDYAEYETRVEYTPKIQGDSVYFITMIHEEKLLDFCNTDRYPAGPVKAKAPKPIALSDIEVEV